MSRLMRVVLCVLFCSLLVSCGAAKLEPLTADGVILAFGDSLTYGTGVDKSQSYPAVLAKLTGHTVINEGVPGELSAMGLSRFPNLLNHYHPELVIICHGGNDILQRNPPAQIRENLAAMVKMAQDRGIAVILVGVPNLSLFSSKASGLYLDVADEFSVPIEGHIVGKLMLKAKYKSDSVHFNQKGYQLMAKAIYKLMQKAGAL